MRRSLELLLSNERHVWGCPVRDLYVYFLATFGMMAGLGYSLYLGDAVRYYDERMYLDMGRNLAELSIFSMDGVHPTSARPPGYPFFVSSVFSLDGSILSIRLLQFFLFSASLVLIHRILVQWTCSPAGPIAATLVLFYPVVFYTTATIYPQSLTTFLFLLVTYLVIAKRIDVKRMLAGGIVFGCLVLTTPIFLVTLPCFLLAPWILDYKKRLPSAALFLVITAAMIAPWIFRNYEVFGRFVFISSNSGHVLIMGNSEFAEPNIEWWLADISKYREIAGRTTENEAEFDASLRTQAIEWMRDNKTAALKLYVQKFINHFNFRNRLATASEEAWWKDAIMFLTYYPLLLLAVAQMAFGDRGKSRLLEIYMVTCYLLLAAIYALFLTRIRFRLPLDWFVICMAALYLRTLISKYTARPNTTP